MSIMYHFKDQTEAAVKKVKTVILYTISEQALTVGRHGSVRLNQY